MGVSVSERADVSRETFDRLRVFADLLGRWNRTINLVGAREMDELWDRHIEDSLCLVPLLPATADITDLGSGAGFPGLVLAIATGRRTTLVEADQRKAAFLREAARATGADVRVMADRIEQCGLRGAALITARALAPLPRLLELAAPLLAPDGICLFPKGRHVDLELTAARQEWQMAVHSHSARQSQGGVVLEVKHLRRNNSPR